MELKWYSTVVIKFCFDDDFQTGYQNTRDLCPSFTTFITPFFIDHIVITSTFLF
jgi:hypothetical protein